MDYRWFILCQWSRGTHSPAPPPESWGCLFPVHIPVLPGRAVPSRPRLVLAEPVSPGSARGWLYCRGTSHFRKKNRRKENIPLLPQGISAVYFRAVQGQSQKAMSSRPQAAPESLVPAPGGLCSGAGCRRSIPCTRANAEAVIYSPSQTRKCTKQDTSQSRFEAASWAGPPLPHIHTRLSLPGPSPKPPRHPQAWESPQRGQPQ